MRVDRHVMAFLIVVFSCVATNAQNITVNHKEPDRITAVDLADLLGSTTDVPGLGRKVPGLGILRSNTLHMFGDDMNYASPDLEDSTWNKYSSMLDSVVPGVDVHWFRAWLRMDPDLQRTPLVLNLALDRSIDLFLNGRPILGMDTLHAPRVVGHAASNDSLVVVSLQMPFRCDGKPELIAMRLLAGADRSLREMDLNVTLHTADVNYGVQREVMHYGVFVGINLIILLLSLVIWWLERRDISWLLLALLSLVSVLDTVCEVASSMGLMGLSPNTLKVLHAVNILLVPWPLYLLIRVLASMGVELTRKRRRLYDMGVVFVTFACALFLVAERAGLTDTEDGFAFINDSPWLIIPGLFMLALFGITVAWFAIDVIRLGIQLLRKKGYVRWVGGGAVASSLLSLFLGIIGEFTATGTSVWLSLLSDYCSYVAVPVSVAIYLAIRSAHHNRLVERQRDDLDREVQERTAELRAERDRSDELLLNILPAEVAEELKTQGTSEARHFDQASVLFTDFKGFTQLSTEVDPGELLSELNACFKAFDDIIGARGIEKIKTIGDAYMCAAGLPDPKTATAVDVVFAALEMQEFMQRRKRERGALGKRAFDMRLGIHSGPVVAGIVGVKKFQYDIWGDTVNTASRMESGGEIGRVNISGSTYQLVRDEPGLTFIPRGKVHAKGLGEMDMYFVQRSDDKG